MTAGLFTLGAYPARNPSGGAAALGHDVPADRIIRLAVAATANEVAIAPNEPS